MTTELTSGSRVKRKIKEFGLLELLGGIAIILTLFTLIGPSVVSNVNTMKRDLMGKEEYLLNSALSQASSLGAPKPGDKNQALLLVSSKIDLPDVQFGPLLTGLPTQQMTVGDVVYQLELVDEKFKYIPVVEVITPEPDPTGQALDLEEEEALALPTPNEGDFAKLEGVVMCGGGISNNATLNGSVVILKAEGPQPSITLGNNVIMGDLV
jgi:hypothetical protein